jgi:hypothetical protein
VTEELVGAVDEVNDQFGFHGVLRLQRAFPIKEGIGGFRSSLGVPENTNSRNR